MQFNLLYIKRYIFLTAHCTLHTSLQDADYLQVLEKALTVVCSGGYGLAQNTAAVCSTLLYRILKSALCPACCVYCVVTSFQCVVRSGLCAVCSV